ncbi:antibiotic biosynthesis monooxygenase [Phytohabitans sp. ZYX-F-186]|uniref:Antibiotic biosynthesis monooxygenase n=1 Tax=Phytohabitans maris TaxID=3071409 RepID=A0ABU0ZTR6_9ACTN|nr:antibiotic biosynthesis monooxygenase [Phytohabitans sp. ZYX-F-186]MDQ7909872.1 antibiotic biosynthesis monooxygenase [Phytohabitans sp. ZYX-F-186]
MTTINHGFHATLTAQDGRGDELVDFLLKAPSPPDDCVVFLVGRSASDPDTVYVTEGWTSREAHERIVGTAEAQDTMARLQALLAQKPEYIDEVPIGGKAAI